MKYTAEIEIPQRREHGGVAVRVDNGCYKMEITSVDPKHICSFLEALAAEVTREIGSIESQRERGI